MLRYRVEKCSMYKTEQNVGLVNKGCALSDSDFYYVLGVFFTNVLLFNDEMIIFICAPIRTKQIQIHLLHHIS